MKKNLNLIIISSLLLGNGIYALTGPSSPLNLMSAMVCGMLLVMLVYELFRPWRRYTELLHEYYRIEYDYGCVLDHATGGRMSKTIYQTGVIYPEIDDYQQEHYWEIIKSDIGDIVNDGGDMDDVKKYVDSL